jgi:hypothetical protein
MEAIGRLAGGVAHDFNNMLMVIKGHTELLLNVLSPSDHITRKIQHIDRAADRATTLTRQLLAFSRMQVLQPQVINLNSVVEEMGKLLPRLIGEHIEFIFLPEPALATVLADPGQIEQVFLNLLSNRAYILHLKPAPAATEGATPTDFDLDRKQWVMLLLAARRPVEALTAARSLVAVAASICGDSAPHAVHDAFVRAGSQQPFGWTGRMGSSFSELSAGAQWRRGGSGFV